MMHPDTELKLINTQKGLGVVATAPIPKGTITWVQDELDIVFSSDKVAKLNSYTAALFEKFSFRNGNGDFILCWDNAKYINHSFNSNCLSTAYDFEIAIRDIAIGEELTDDYGYLNLDKAFVPEDEGVERKIVHPDDTLLCYKNWDMILKSLFPILTEIDQPLLNLLAPEIQEEVRQVASGRKKMVSTINLYFQPEKAEFKSGNFSQ